MKFLFASVPQWYPVSPYLSGALLAGQLNNAGFEADTFDFNIEFFNDILKSEYVKESLEKAKAFLHKDVCFQYDVNCSEDIKECFLNYVSYFRFP